MRKRFIELRKKSWFVSVMAAVLLALAVGVTSLFGAGTVSQSTAYLGKGVYLTTFSCAGDTSDGSFPEFTTDKNIDGKVLFVVTDPSGVTAPTDNYDIVFNDSTTCDVFGGELANRSTSVTQQAEPKIGSGYGPRYVNGPLTGVITNSSVTDARLTIYLYFERE